MTFESSPIRWRDSIFEGNMISVSIAINGEPIFARSAVNVGTQSCGRTKYSLDDGTSLLHKREDGAVRLAIEMLKTIKEPGVSEIPKDSNVKSGRKVRLW